MVRRTGEGEAAETKTRRKPGATDGARSLRKDGTKAEALLWIELKARRLGGYHFVRQHPVGPYIADFACRSNRLIIEVDGSQHAESAYDRRRDDYMRSLGYSVLRFWNDDVLKQRRSVCETILAVLEGRLAESVIAADMRFVFASPVRKPGIKALVP